MALNFWSSCLYLPNVGITDMCHTHHFYTVLEIPPRALCILSKHSSNWVTPLLPQRLYSWEQCLELWVFFPPLKFVVDNLTFLYRGCWLKNFLKWFQSNLSSQNCPNKNQHRRYTTAILALRWWREKNQEFKASLYYIMTSKPYLNTNRECDGPGL